MSVVFLVVFHLIIQFALNHNLLNIDKFDIIINIKQ